MQILSRSQLNIWNENPTTIVSAERAILTRPRHTKHTGGKEWQ